MMVRQRAWAQTGWGSHPSAALAGRVMLARSLPPRTPDPLSCGRAKTYSLCGALGGSAEPGQNGFVSCEVSAQEG